MNEKQKEMAKVLVAIVATLPLLSLNIEDQNHRSFALLSSVGHLLYMKYLLS